MYLIYHIGIGIYENKSEYENKMKSENNNEY